MIAVGVIALLLAYVIRLKFRHHTETRAAYYAGIQKAVNEIGERQGISDYHGQVMAAKERRN